MAELGTQGFIVTPMIWRAGACVAIPREDGSHEIGLLIPHGNGCNFNQENLSYKILTGQGTTRSISFMEVFSHLIPAGTEVYLDTKSRTVQALGLEFNQGDLPKHHLHCRLNVPPTADPDPLKVHIVCLCKPLLANSGTTAVGSERFQVDPWDLRLASDPVDPHQVISHLVYNGLSQH